LQHLLNKAYPSVLRTAIIEYTDYYISEKTKIVNTQSNIILYNIGLSEIVVQYVRYLYALYRVFLPGIKHLANYRYIIEEKELSRDIKDLFKNYNNALKIISGKRSLK
jgi:hypothetical protein